MSGRNVNIYFQEENYNQIEKLIKERKVSQLVNKLVEEWAQKERQQNKEELEKKIIEGYQRSAKNKKLQAELRALEAASVEDVFTALEKRENE